MTEGSRTDTLVAPANLLLTSHSSCLLHTHCAPATHLPCEPTVRWLPTCPVHLLCAGCPPALLSSCLYCCVFIWTYPCFLSQAVSFAPPTPVDAQNPLQTPHLSPSTGRCRAGGSRALPCRRQPSAAAQCGRWGWLGLGLAKPEPCICGIEPVALGSGHHHRGAWLHPSPSPAETCRDLCPSGQGHGRVLCSSGVRSGGTRQDPRGLSCG